MTFPVRMCVQYAVFNFLLMPVLSFFLSFQKDPVFGAEIDHHRFKSLPAISSRVSDLTTLEVCMRTNRPSCCPLFSLFTSLTVQSHPKQGGPNWSIHNCGAWDSLMHGSHQLHCPMDGALSVCLYNVVLWVVCYDIIMLFCSEFFY